MIALSFADPLKMKHCMRFFLSMYTKTIRHQVSNKTHVSLDWNWHPLGPLQIPDMNHCHQPKTKIIRPFKHRLRLFTAYIWLKCQSKSFSPTRKCQSAICSCMTVVLEISFLKNSQRTTSIYIDTLLQEIAQGLLGHRPYYVDPMSMFHLLHHSSKLGRM